MNGARPTAADTLELRELARANTEALARFLARNDVPAVTSTFDPFPMTSETAASLLARRRKDRYYGAFTPRGEIVALSMLRGWDEGFSLPSFGIAVDAGWHGRGVGSRLTGWTIAQARTLGSPRVRLSVYSDNPVAVRMYRRLGFEEVERGSTERADRERIVMVLDLDEGPGRLETMRGLARGA